MTKISSKKIEGLKVLVFICVEAHPTPKVSGKIDSSAKSVPPYGKLKISIYHPTNQKLASKKFAIAACLNRPNGIIMHTECWFD